MTVREIVALDEPLAQPDRPFTDPTLNRDLMSPLDWWSEDDVTLTIHEIREL